MTDLTDHILTITNQRPTESDLSPCIDRNRRATWIPVHGEKVTVWRMRSYDPDVDEYEHGTFVSETDDSYTLIVDGVTETFQKRNKYGNRDWYLNSRERKQELGLTDD